MDVPLFHARTKQDLVPGAGRHALGSRRSCFAARPDCARRRNIPQLGGQTSAPFSTRATHLLGVRHARRTAQGYPFSMIHSTFEGRERPGAQSKDFGFCSGCFSGPAKKGRSVVLPMTLARRWAVGVAESSVSLGHKKDDTRGVLKYCGR